MMCNQFSGKEDVSMHVTEEFEDRLVNRIVEALEPKFEAIDKRFDGHDERFDGIELEFAAIRVEMQSESNRICEKIDNLDRRVGRLETVAQANWNVPEINIRLGAAEEVIKNHTDQISNLNRQLGIAN